MSVTGYESVSVCHMKDERMKVSTIKAKFNFP